MKLTQGTFSYLPDLTDEQISKQVQYCIDNGWAVNLEFSDDPHPRNTYWEMWGMPMFDVKDAAGGESIRLSFIVNRPKGEEKGFRLERQEVDGERY